ncbi:carbohydrate kinase family protein, partial [bacterium]
MAAPGKGGSVAVLPVLWTGRRNSKIIILSFVIFVFPRGNEMSDCDVLVLADYFCDIIITGLPEPPRLGADLFGEAMEIVPGGAYILATAMHRLGVKARWMARLGNDLFSQFILDASRREGLDTSLFQMFERPLRSVSVAFSFVHDRGFISFQDLFPVTPA